MSLVLDSDFLIALYKKDDTNHQRALRLTEKVAQQKARVLMSVFVYSEVATVLSQRVGQRSAAAFIQDVREHEVPLLHSDQVWFEQARKVFLRQTSENISFVDATNIALAQLVGATAIVSFDKDYKKNGLTLFD